MTIQAIVNAEQSAAKQAANASKMRSNHYNALEDEKVTAIDAVHHYFGHNCAATMVNTKKLFQDYGTKESEEAFAFLAYEFTGACKDNSKDTERHDKALPLYLKELAAIEEQGLTVWFKGKMASDNGEESEELTAEQKKAKREAKAEAKKVETGKEYLADLLAEDPSMKLAMQWRDAYNALALKDPKQAAEMAQADIKQLSDSLATKIAGLAA